MSVECRNARAESLLKLLDGKDVQVGVIDVATDEVETPDQVAAVIGEAMKYVAREKIIAGTNCGMAPMRWDIAFAKLAALGQGAELARKKFAERHRYRSLRLSTSISSLILRRCSRLLPLAMACSTQWPT